MTYERERFFISAQDADLRLDKLLSSRYPEQSRTYFQNLIDQHLVLVNELPVKKRTKLQKGDLVSVTFALTKEISLDPENIPLDILYEDDDLLAIHKPVGMVVHPAPGNWTGTFVNALIHHLKELPGGGEGLRPGIVHRLDKNTSGILLAAKTPQAHQRLVTDFSCRRVKKTYLAICIGSVPQIEASVPISRHPKQRKKMAVSLEGKEAYTSFIPLSTHELFSLVEAHPTTGRTHQIRVHLQHLGFPILGDEIYGNLRINKKYKIPHHLLHAWKLQFTHPINGRKIHLQAPLPQFMEDMMVKLGLTLSLGPA